MLLEPLERLIEALTLLPGVGKKTAGRLAFFLLESPKSKGETLAQAITSVLSEVTRCPQCGFYMEREAPCGICEDPRRDQGTMCIVSKAQDLLAIEASHSFFGQYHILGGTIAPLDGVSPGDLRIEELFSRINEGSYTEAILALDATVDGETTSQYLLAHLPDSLKVTRIAAGIPFGAELEYTDKVTLSRALSMRRDYSEPG